MKKRKEKICHGVDFTYWLLSKKNKSETRKSNPLVPDTCRCGEAGQVWSVRITLWKWMDELLSRMNDISLRRGLAVLV